MPVTGIGYNGYKINVAKYGERQEPEIKKGKGQKKYCYITDLPIKKKNVAEITGAGRKRWKIENVHKEN